MIRKIEDRKCTDRYETINFAQQHIENISIEVLSFNICTSLVCAADYDEFGQLFSCHLDAKVF